MSSVLCRSERPLGKKMNGVNFNASVRIDLSTLRDVEPAKVEAIMAGIAKIVTAESDAGLSSDPPSDGGES